LDFIRNAPDGESLPIDTTNLPLRWASGGVLSIVNWRGRKWVPLFFRDIQPYGWNLSLGSTERYFDKGGIEINNDDYSLEAELCWPWKFLIREFLEETVILERYPQLGRECRRRKFVFAQDLQVRVSQEQALKFAEEHIDLRSNQDGLTIEHGDTIRPRVISDTIIDLGIEGSETSAEEGEVHGLVDVLVAINPLEIGIEVVKVLEYGLGEENVILDGEVYLINNKQQMVRMPVGLVSLEYLYKTFGSKTFQLKYDDSDIQPSVEGSPFEARDIHVWEWDIDRRKDEWSKREATSWEMQRYLNWQQNFEGNFLKGLAGNPSIIPRNFTPATAKLMNLFFNCSRTGQVLSQGYENENSS
jgi:hypothetical protein